MPSHFLHTPLALGASQAAIAIVLALAVALLARAQGIHLERDTAISLGRGAGQIILVGFILVVLLKGPVAFSLLALTVMISAAGPIAAERARRVPGALPAAVFGIALGAALVITAMTLVGVIPYGVTSLVPVGSMIINSAMNASAQTLERFGADVLDHTGQIEAALALGAAPPATVLPYLRNAVGASLIPSLNSIRSLGIVWIPGLMAGMLLTGADPVYAAIYQFVLVAMMYAAAGLAALGTAWLVRGRVFSPAEQLILRPGHPVGA
jgi:putative ABC transport system permease protein